MRDDKTKQRNPNMFEYVLLVMGILVISIGYFFVHNVIMSHGLVSFESTTVLLIWFISIILVILTAVGENSKEELKIIIKQQHAEMKLLRDDLRRKK